MTERGRYAGRSLRFDTPSFDISDGYDTRYVYADDDLAAIVATYVERVVRGERKFFCVRRYPFDEPSQGDAEK